MTKPYQDVWVKGRMVSAGVRECAERYALIRSFCSQYRRPFTVLDVGAADGYFAIRLAEDFPDCTVAAVEPRQRIGVVLRQNEAERVLWLQVKLAVDDLRILAEVEHFDVTLALSVIHWMNQPPEESLAILRGLGDHLILELPVEDTACGQEVVREIETPADGILLGYGQSHLDATARRPIYLLSQEKTCLARSYWDSPYPSLARIDSSFDAKTFRKGKKLAYPWMRGINLQTFLSLNGVWPSREHVARCVQAAYERFGGPHGDLSPWNIIWQGDHAVLIDPKPQRKRAMADAEVLERLVAKIMGKARDEKCAG